MGVFRFWIEYRRKNIICEYFFNECHEQDKTYQANIVQNVTFCALWLELSKQQLTGV